MSHWHDFSSKENETNGSAFKQETISLLYTANLLSFLFLFFFPPSLGIRFPSTASFFVILNCSSDGSEIIRLPSWLNMDGMGCFDLNFSFIGMHTHMVSRTPTPTVHMAQTGTGSDETVFGFEIVPCLLSVTQMIGVRRTSLLRETTSRLSGRPLNCTSVSFLAPLMHNILLCFHCNTLHT